MIKRNNVINMKKMKIYLVIAMLISIPVMSQPMNKNNFAESNIMYSQAESEYKKHNYNEAIDLYKNALVKKPDDKTKKEIILKLIEILILAKKWDESIAEFDKSIKLFANDNYWQAKINRLGADLYLSVPHQGYKRDNKVYRNQDVREGDYVYIAEDDQKKSNQLFEKSKDLYAKLKPTKIINQEIINLNFDYAQSLTQSEYIVRPLIKRQVNVKPDFKKMDNFEKIVFLYDEVFELNKIIKNTHNEANSIFKKATYFVRKNGISFDYENPENKLLVDQNPLPLLKEVTKKYPKDELAPEATYGIAQIYASKQNFISALEYYQDILTKYPKSIRVSDAKAELQEIKSKYLAINNPGFQNSKDKPKISITTKNINNVDIKVYKTDLLNILKKKTKSTDVYFNNFNQNFGEKISDVKKNFGQKVLGLKSTTDYKNDYKSVTKEITLPDIKAGSYLVEVTDGEKNSSVSLLIISDITIVKNIDKDQSIIHMVDRDTGKPLKDVNIFVKEHYYAQNESNSGYNVKTLEGKTNSEGEFIYKKYSKSISYSYVDVLAWKDDQIIFSNAQYYYNYNTANKTYKGYIYTDRPVYRPEQKVNFKEIITANEDGKNKNLANKKVKVIITDTKGDQVYEKDLTTNSFGSINDSFTLKKGAALGMYYINTSVENAEYNITQSGGQSFRVEEYKKPEFIVNAKVENAKYKPGDKVKVNISTDYYFGSPVANAKVKYRVLKTPFYPYYQTYDRFYTKSYFGGIRGESNYQSEIVWKQGELTSDGNGKAYLEFETEKSKEDFKYDILIDVTDKSRREIKGSASVKVTNAPYYAFINLKQGFYSAGENADIEISLRNANDEPVQDKGQLKIYSVKYTGKDNQKEELKEIFSKNVETDKKGNITYRWKTDKEGSYKVVFESSNTEKVVGEKIVWINGKNFDGRYYKFQNIEILTDKPEYQEGETARLMLSTNFPDAHVILYTENDKEILAHKLIHITNKSKVVEIKIGKQYVPNFNIKAVLVKNSQMYLENKEVFVPPTKQFLNVAIASDKENYLPGEKTFLKVKTTDHNNKPVSSEISLSVADSSVYYIQSDLSGDIQNFYYGDIKYFQNNVASSLGLYLYAITEDLNKKENYPRHNGPFDFYQFYGSHTENASLARSAAPVAFEAEAMMDDKAAPMPASPKQMMKKEADASGAVTQNALKPAEIREYFPDTALWKPVLVTDKNGNAQVELDFPDSLTTWKINTKAIDKNSRVGSATDEVITRKNITARLQAPRFFIEKDEVTISAVINNDLDQSKNVQATIETSDELENIGDKTINVNIDTKGEKRVDWKFKVKKVGQAKITLKALTDVESDATETKFPVLIHGIDKYVAQNGMLKTNESAKELTLTIPEQRRKSDTKVNITLNTSIISTLIDSIPYLASYPYGCVEQTTSRFIPALLVNKIVKKSGVNFDKLSPDKQGIEMTKFLDKRNSNPVYNTALLNDMVTEGLKRLYTFQNSDGGFGWWSGFESDNYMSTYVTYSLILAKQSDYSIDNSVLERALSFVATKFSSDDQIYDRLYMAYVLSMEKKISADKLEGFFKQRDSLNNYGKALLSLAYFNLGDKAKADLICQNLKTFATVDETSGTASWKNDTKFYWYWYGDRIETNTFVFKAFMKSRPNDKVTPMIAKWLLENREGNHWYSTKDTANTIYALTEYAEINKELNPDYTLSVFYNNKLLKKIKVNKENMFDFDNSIQLEEKDLDNSQGKIKIVREGKGNLYYSATAEYFSLEENIKAASNMIAVNRDYYKLSEKKDKDNKIAYDKTLIKDGDILKSGDLVEVKLTVKSNNDYEYLIFEDMKPAGLEATEVNSGYVYQNGISLSREIRDEKNVFFANDLAQGTQIITYNLRAEVPGRFHALPTKSYAMYAPQIRANSDEKVIQVTD